MQSTVPAESSFVAALGCLQTPEPSQARVIQAAQHGMEGVTHLLTVAKSGELPTASPAPKRADEVFQCLALGEQLTRRQCVLNQLEARHGSCNHTCKVGVGNQDFVDLVRIQKVR